MKRKFPSPYTQLIGAARRARQNSHSPYSGFRVGAALLTSSGRIYTGCNIENSSYGLTICAERTAIFKAISEGEHRFRAMAIVSDSGDLTPPCGACRQVLMDLASNIDFVMSDGKQKHAAVPLKSLLPYPFDSKSLSRRGRPRNRA